MFGLWVLYSGTTLVQRIMGFTPALLSSRRRLFSFAAAALAMPVRSPADVLCVHNGTHPAPGAGCGSQAFFHSASVLAQGEILSGTPLIWVQMLGVTDIF